jgi:hypothetical protein
MNLITTLYNEELEELSQLPPSKKVEYVYVGQELAPAKNSSLFGKKIYVIYVYGQQEIGKLLAMLEKLSPFVLAVDPLSYSSITRLAYDNGLEHQVAEITEKGFVKWLQNLFPGASPFRCGEVARDFNCNIWSVYHSRDNIAKYLNGAVKLKDIQRTHPFNFNQMLLYIAGDPTIKREDYVRAVVKYRLAIKKFRTISRKSLKSYINSIVDGETPDRFSRKLANFITVESALLLYEELEEITVPQLLGK